MARVYAKDDAGPAAFDVTLGISTGRHSPECDPTAIMVNAETKVHWFFLEGAYVLHHVHGRDSNQLQKDFDLYLIRPGRDDIGLHPSREIADYGIKKGDNLQLRHKTIPITICVDLHHGLQKDIEVNSGFPVMDIVPSICEKLGIRNDQELSLAFASPSDCEQASKLSWLDLSSSLNGQAVKDGDTLLLRKKFFILNDDIHEAMEGNEDLLELIYHQIHDLYLTETFIGGEQDIKTLAKVSALLHHIEQGDDNISDDQAVGKVMPRNKRGDTSFYTQVVTTYYQERFSTLQKEEAKIELLKIFCEPQSIILTHYPVKISEESDDYILAVDSDTITVCEDSGGQLKVVDSKVWRLRDLRDADHTHKEKLVSVNVLGSWQELFTSYTTQIANHLMEAHGLLKKKVARARISHRISTPTTPELLNSPSQLEEQKEEEEEEEARNVSRVTLEPPVAVDVAPAVQENEILVEQEITAEDLFEMPPLDQPEEDQQEEERGEEGEEEEVKEEEPAEETKVDLPAQEKVDNIVLVQLEQQPDLTPAEDQVPDTREEAPPASPPGTQGPPGKRPTNVITLEPAITPAPQLISEPPPNTPMSVVGEEVKKSPSRSTGSAASKVIHIPEYLGLDYRKVLDDYRLFHIVIVKQEIRTLLLHIRRPVREIIDSVCGTFNISKPNEYHLWIPSGIQAIIEKYGGRPKSRIGRFVRRSSSFSGNFSPRLDVDKPLEDQYNFGIKPYLLHLRRYQPEEETDADEEVDCGQEWPDCENIDVANYRQFYQSWCGVVQGAYPVDKANAVKLAALLTHVYYGDRSKAKVWPPRDYDIKRFLPEKHQAVFGITTEVEKAHKDLSGKSVQDCISMAVDCCKKVLTFQGVFFEVAVPKKTDIMMVIPWKKMQQRLFGVNHHGIFSVDKETGKILFTHRFSDIYDWSASENSFHLNFKQWDEDYRAYTFQTREILDLLELFIDMTMKGRIKQAPPRPPSLSIEGTKPSSPQKSQSPLRSTSPKAASPEPFTPGPGEASPKKIPLDLEESTKRSSTSTPTTYDVIDL